MTTATSTTPITASAESAGAMDTSVVDHRHSVNYIARKMMHAPAVLARSYRMDRLDTAETDEFEITAHLYTSIYGGTVLFEVVEPHDDSVVGEHPQRYILLAGDVFSSRQLTAVADTTGQREPVAVIGTDDGLSVVTRETIIDAVNSASPSVQTSRIGGFWPCDDYHQGNADEASESPLRDPVSSGTLIAVADTGELFGFSYDDLAADDEQTHPRYLGVHSTEIGGTYLLSDGHNVVQSVDCRDISIDDMSQPGNTQPSPKNYGVRAAIFRSGATTITINRINAAPLRIEAMPITSGSGVREGIVLFNLDRSENAGLSVYLHGGPEYYVTTVCDLLADTPVLADLLDASAAVYMPFLSRSTDYAHPSEFTTRGLFADSPILGDTGNEAADILDSTRQLSDIHDLHPGSLYAESMGGHIGLGMLAYCAADEINNTFSSIVIDRGLLDPYEPLESGQFTAHQCASLRGGIDPQFQPIDFLGTEEWVQLNHSELHPDVTVIASTADPICSPHTAAAVCDLLSNGDYAATVFIDECGHGHEGSPVGKRYAISQFL